MRIERATPAAPSRRRIVNHRKPFLIDWDINSRCTYNCTYCPPYLKDVNNFIYNRRDDSAIITDFFNKLEPQIADRNVHMQLSGGEPTLAPGFNTIINFAKAHNWNVSVNTNASRSIRWWREHLPALNKVNISYHPEQAPDTLIDKIKQMQLMGKISPEHHVFISVFTLMYPPLFDKARKMYDKLSNIKGVVLVPSRVFKRGDHYDDVLERHRAQQSKKEESYDYTPKQEAWLIANSTPIGEWRYPDWIQTDRLFGETFIEEYYNEKTNLGLGPLKNKERLFPEKIVNERKNSFKGWHCNIGVDYIRIENYGEIYTASCKAQKKIADIKSFKSLPQKPTICNAEWCMCTAEVQVPKSIGFIK